MIQIIQFRELGIKDLTFAVRRKSNQFASLEPFQKAGMVTMLEPHEEERFLRDLVLTHPTHKKDFEHFLIDPPKNITPSMVAKELEVRSDLVPTLCVVKTHSRDANKVVSIERIRDHYDLLSLLAESVSEGLIEASPVFGGAT